MTKLPFFDKQKSKSDELLDNCCPKLTYKQRLIGFLICSVIGWVVSALSLGIFFGRNRSITRFALLYTIGNIVSLSGTCFLSGPKSQVKDMKKPQRMITSIVYLLSMIGTLIFALAIEQDVVCILFVLVQFCSYVWYSLSFIPFGQKIAKKVCCSCLNGETNA